ncbi:hypothetical protein tb265_04030 [Gemmatimonadetes bacterium T265]|nr:hypothetical protein tb265_04030 [Gemmatimonadetes bacterium T265]
MPGADTATGGPGLPAYGVVRGRPLEQRVYPAAGSPTPGAGPTPHLHVLVDGGTERYDVAVNVFSQDRSEVLFRIATDFTPARAADLLALPLGATPIGPGHPDGLGLDYLRQRLVTRDEMTLLPVDPAHPAVDLQNALGALVASAIAAGADVFAFGSLYDDPGGGAPTGANPFGLTPDAGVHDVHMNQGNPPDDHGQDNGTFQDGALLVHVPGSPDGWTAVFLAFQSQSFAV